MAGGMRAKGGAAGQQLFRSSPHFHRSHFEPGRDRLRSSLHAHTRVDRMERSVSTIDGWIEKLMTCKHLTEQEVTELCEKVRVLSM